MRRLNRALLLLGIALATAACKRHAHTQPSQELLSVLAMDDPRADAQLPRGFYPPEGGSWRWTAGKFSVILQPPPGAEQYGARLELKLNLPDAVLKQAGALTLAAEIAGTQLAPETFAKAGNYIYARDVPGSLLGGDRVEIDFSTDKPILAGKLEKRELGLIVTSVGLVLK
jgi:hypothetical protein